MKKSINCLFFLFFTLTCYLTQAQTYRFIYSLEFKSNKDKDYYEKDIIVTDINKTSIKSYSYDFLKYDSINKVNRNTFFASPKFEERFVKQKETNVTVNYENFLENVYTYESNDVMKWNIINEFKSIESFKVQKAICDFGGRKWVAWFSSDFVFPYGPYKFYGLPGMILEINDSENHYHFKFYRNINLKEEYNTMEFLESYYGSKPIKISLPQLLKLKKNYYKDPYMEFKLGQKKGNFQDSNGNTLENPDYTKLSKEVREYLDNNNNTLEKNKIINYKK